MAIVLTLNAGSSSVKFSVYTPIPVGLEPLAAGQVEGLGAKAHFAVKTAAGERHEHYFEDCTGPADHGVAIRAILDWLQTRYSEQPVVAVGHRVVHGGVEFVQPVALDDNVMTQLERLVPLAPLHQPHNLAGVRAALAALPHALQVACFDTAFHRTHSYVADTFALPRNYYDQGIRRYGFHGLSYEFIVRQLRQQEPELAQGRVIVAHLGNGASMCAIRDGKSVASTMGFTALDGMPMGTRCGQIDPGVLLYLLTHYGMSAEQITDLLYKNSGLKGLSGLSQDVRELEAANTQAARDALAYFTDRGRREIGGLAASIGGLDALVLTGGIGEHAANVREALLHDMGWLGIQLDAQANRAGQTVISLPNSPVKVLVMATDEERMLAEHAARVAGILH